MYLPSWTPYRGSRSPACRRRSSTGRICDRLGVEILVKRDDLTGLGFGGNKARKLEYLMAEAVAAGADLVMSRWRRTIQPCPHDRGRLRPGWGWPVNCTWSDSGAPSGGQSVA